MATTTTARRARTRRQRPLTRERIVREALSLVDEDGLDGLTMRRLGKRLRVEAMSLYNHVPSKDALCDGIRELLWDELRDAVGRGQDWRSALRSVAYCLRCLAHSHPQAFPLIAGGTSLAEPMLRTLAAGLATLEEAGFDRARAAKTLTAIVHYALGYALMELSYRSALPATRDGKLDTMVELTRALPSDTPAELVRVAHDCCARDLDQQFEFGLEALLAGLDPGCETFEPA